MVPMFIAVADIQERVETRKNEVHLCYQVPRRAKAITFFMNFFLCCWVLFGVTCMVLWGFWHFDRRIDFVMWMFAAGLSATATFLAHFFCVLLLELEVRLSIEEVTLNELPVDVQHLASFFLQQNPNGAVFHEKRIRHGYCVKHRMIFTSDGHSFCVDL